MTTPEDVAQSASILGTAFADAGFEYAVGGAIAYNFWGIPRGTLDVDITVFAQPEQLDQVIRVLQEAGCELDPEKAAEDVPRQGMFKARHGDLRVDVFLPDIPLYEAARLRRREVSLEGRPLWIWSPEDLLLFKLLYFRAKDRVDMEYLLMTRRPEIDLTYIWDWLHRMVGPDDDRCTWLREQLDSPP